MVLVSLDVPEIATYLEALTKSKPVTSHAVPILVLQFSIYKLQIFHFFQTKLTGPVAMINTVLADMPGAFQVTIQ
jgi:hypothetical protein